jgi:hypothetical protein
MAGFPETHSSVRRDEEPPRSASSRNQPGRWSGVPVGSREMSGRPPSRLP